VVASGSAIYAIAGTSVSGQPVLELERFDGTAWADIATLPGAGLNAPAAAMIGSKIYLIGGFLTTTNAPTANVAVYDTLTHAWTTAAPLPSARGGHAAVTFAGRIHVFGGGNSVSTLAEHFAYDPASNSWTTLAPLPRSEGSPAVAVLNGKIWLLGGRSGASDFGNVDVYDPATDNWSAGAPITPHGTAGAVPYCGTIFLFGGESQASGSTLAWAHKLDPVRGAWVSVKWMPTARNFARAVPFGSDVLVVGGSLAPGSSHSAAGSGVVERYHSDCP
jgi:N-acetylneuraminic acid mutarotase